jgi:DNA-binding MarR family transcriptional regulator
VQPPPSVDTVAAFLEHSALLVIRQLSDRGEVSVTALDVLHRLDTEGPVRLTALAAVAGVSQPSMSQLVQRFERRGVAQRTADPRDGRATLVTITDAGRGLLEEHRREVREKLANLMATLHSDDRAGLELAARVALPLLDRMIDDDPTRVAQRVSVRS